MSDGPTVERIAEAIAQETCTCGHPRLRHGGMGELMCTVQVGTMDDWVWCHCVEYEAAPL